MASRAPAFAPKLCRKVTLGVAWFAVSGGVVDVLIAGARNGTVSQVHPPARPRIAASNVRRSAGPILKTQPHNDDRPRGRPAQIATPDSATAAAADRSVTTPRQVVALVVFPVSLPHAGNAVQARVAHEEMILIEVDVDLRRSANSPQEVKQKSQLINPDQR